MSTFSSSWLTLREQADRAARSQDILALVGQAFASYTRCHICDLGAGTGALLRAISPFLPAAQRWTLVDHDPALLEASESHLRSWYDEEPGQSSGDAIELHGTNYRISVYRRVADLSDVRSAWPQRVHLVTASALFDLVSESWIDRFAAMAVDAGAHVLATLNFDGKIVFSPEHEDDEHVRAAFIAHQKRDKGFGPAAGPDGGIKLARALESRGFDVKTAESPWRLNENDRDLMAAFVEGLAIAVAETGNVPGRRLNSWHQSRTACLQSLRVGHMDIFATPPR